MKVTIKFYRGRAGDTAHATGGRVNRSVVDADDAIKLARSLLVSLDTPQGPDFIAILDDQENTFYCAPAIPGREIGSTQPSEVSAWENGAVLSPTRPSRVPPIQKRHWCLTPEHGDTIMTLTFPNRSRSYDEARQRVRFIGHDGVFEVPFFVETDALAASAAGEAHYLAAFDAAHATIHDVARQIYGSARRTAYVLTAADFR